MSILQIGIIFLGILSISLGLAALNNGNFGGRFFGADREEKPLLFWTAIIGLFLIGAYTMYYVMTR